MKNIKAFEELNEVFGRSKPDPLDKESSEIINSVIKELNDDIVRLMKDNKLFKFLEDKTKVLVIEDVYKRLSKPGLNNDEIKAFEKYKKSIIDNILWIHK